MSASDPFSILNRDPKRTYLPAQQSKPTVQRLRAGQVPQWALSDQTQPQNSDFHKLLTQKETKLKYTGLTADASGLIIDTELGKREVITTVEDNGDERRAKIKQKMMELERLKQQDEENGEDDEDLFGSENEPVVVDEKGQEVEQQEEELFESENGNNFKDEEDEGDVQETTAAITLLKPVFLSKADREAMQASKEKQQ